jgi:hypothetical protein
VAITLALLAAVLVAVVAAVTLAYRAKLNSDLRSRLTAAGAAVERKRSGGAAKELAQGLALEGISTRIGSARAPLPAGKGFPALAPVKTGSSIRTQGSLLVLEEVLPDRTQVAFSASRTSIDNNVRSLLVVEVLVALAALALAAILFSAGHGPPCDRSRS